MAFWIKKNLFSSPLNSMISLLVISFVFKFLTFFNDWLFFKSVWSGDAHSCHQSSGACLIFIKEKFRFILFGSYPYEKHWRPVLALLAFFGFVFLSLKNTNFLILNIKKILVCFFILLVSLYLLMSGFFFGSQHISISQWGGLPLTIILSTFGILLSYPLGILLALGRHSKLTFIKPLCILYIELVRGIPLISVLFIFSVLFPLFLPEGIELESKFLRAQLAIIFFMAAYMAEVVRGGLNGVDQGQYEAAKSLGLTHTQTLRFIILPQALKMVIPPTVNTAIGMFKDTSLVFILSMFDLLGTAKASLKDPNWQGFSLEAYFFVAVIYFIFCFSMGSYSKKLEGQDVS